MFSGLTNQVTSWIGARGVEEPKSDLPVPEETTILNEEGQEDIKKDASGAAVGGGGGLIGSVKSSMTSWIVSKTGRGVPSPEAELPPASPTLKEKEKDDDDNSSATGGADSEGGASEGSGTPTEDQAGGQNFAAKIAIGKSLGTLLYSAVNKAGKTVSEASAKIKKTVEENSLLGEFNKEQEAFIKEKSNKNGGAPVPPWVGCPNQEALREECLALSTDRRNFVRAPPEGVGFSFDMETEFPVCQAILQEDPNLEKMRFELVPKVISEENFWRNYLYRVTLICQAAEVSNMAETAGIGKTDSTTGDETGFVSEEFAASSADMKEVEEGMRKLGIRSDQESLEWEKELEAELQDYEMVGDKSIGNSDLIDSDIDDLK